MTVAEMSDVVDCRCAHPHSGRRSIVGTGGCRKVRIPRERGGKSGGYRVITFFGGDDVPVFLADRVWQERESQSEHAQNATALVEDDCDPRRRLPARRNEGHAMSKQAFDKIAAGLTDAIAIARGEADPATYRLHVPPEVDVKKIRRKQRLTQVEFAARYGLNVARAARLGTAPLAPRQRRARLPDGDRPRTGGGPARAGRSTHGLMTPAAVRPTG